MTQRNIVEIDEQRCDGCGQCASACAEGAIQIRDGKARLVSEAYCDGLGACLGQCPRGAIRITQRESEPFSEEAARQHMADLLAKKTVEQAPTGCPGAAVRMLQRLDARAIPAPAAQCAAGSGLPAEAPALRNWPVQLRLVPPEAPFLNDADLLLVADCVPFALADFHRQLLHGRPVVIGCPKLDDAQFYIEKLAAVLTASAVRSLTVVHMEVPCCTGLVRIAEAARRLSGRNIPLDQVTVGIGGRRTQPAPL